MNIGLGTAAIGRPHYINIQTHSKETTPFHKADFIEQGIRILSDAYQKGVRHFDTAPGYGIAEQILLQWIELEQPKEITISTKWGYTYVANFKLNAPQHEVKEHSLKKLNEQWIYSSKFLPHLSIYQIHSATLDSGVLENKEVLNRLFELKQEFNIEIGLSVSGENQNEIILKALEISINNEDLFDSIQVTFNVFDQSLLLLIDQLHQSGKKIIIKEALANGRIFPNVNYPHYDHAYNQLQLLAKKYKVGIDAIAIQFCLAVAQPISVLSGASNAIQLSSNLDGNSFQFLPEEIIALKALSVPPNQYWNERKQLAWN